MKRALTLGVLGLTGVMALGTAAGTRADDRDRDRSENRDRNEKREKLDHQEMVFLRDRAQDDVNMWKLGEYAAQHGATDRVRHLGQAVVDERRTDLRDLQKIAQDHDEDLKVPESMTARQKYRFDELQRKPGANFDRDYTKDLVANYETVIPQLKRERDQAGHVDVREYAARNLKMFEDHLKEARDAQREVWK